MTNEVLPESTRKKLVEGLNWFSPEMQRHLAAIRAADATELASIAVLFWHPDQDVRDIAKSTLATFGRGGIDRLFVALEVIPYGPSVALFELLGELGDPRGADYIMERWPKILKQRASGPATLALAKIDSEKAMLHLIERIARDDDRATDDLLQIGKPVVPYLLRAFVDDYRIRSRRGALLAKIAGEQALAVLLNALQDKLRVIRESAEHGLVLIGKRATTSLIEIVNAESSFGREQAVRLLGRIGDGTAIHALERMACLGRGIERYAAINALSRVSQERGLVVLSRLVNDQDWQVRKQAVNALGQVAETQSVSLLCGALSDSRLRVRLEAIASLKYIAVRRTSGSEAAMLALIRSLDAQDQEIAEAAFDAIVSSGATSLEVIDATTESASGHLRRRLEEAATRIRTKIREMDEATLYSYLCYADAELKAIEATPAIPEPITDAIYLSVSAPLVVAPGTEFILDVWAHLDRPSTFHLPSSRRAPHLRSKGPFPIARGTTMRVLLRLPNFSVDEPEDTIYWEGRRGNASFAVTVPSNVALGHHIGSVSIFVSGFKISTVHFDLEVGKEEAVEGDRTSYEIRVNSAFASYASEDRNEVLGRIQGMLKVLPDLDVFLDVASLRSGDDWQARIMEEITQRDTFYLFWSLAASRSPWVDKEWRVAVDARGPEFIDPVPLDDPSRVPPPLELAGRHFNDWTLAYRKSLPTAE